MFVEEVWSQSSKWYQTWDDQLLYRVQKRWRHKNFFFLDFSVLDTMYRWSMMKNIHSPNWVGIGSWGPKVWPQEYLISPIEISVNWSGSKHLWTGPIYTDFNGANQVFMRPYLGPPWTNSCQIWCVRVIHHVLLKYCHEKCWNAKKKIWWRHTSVLNSGENGVRWAVILYRKSMGSVLVVWILHVVLGRTETCGLFTGCWKILVTSKKARLKCRLACRDALCRDATFPFKKAIPFFSYKIRKFPFFLKIFYYFLNKQCNQLVRWFVIVFL